MWSLSCCGLLLNNEVLELLEELSLKVLIVSLLILSTSDHMSLEILILIDAGFVFLNFPLEMIKVALAS